MNLISIIILLIVAICFIIALRNIFKNSGTGCSGSCGKCMNNTLCSHKKE